MHFIRILNLELKIINIINLISEVMKLDCAAQQIFGDEIYCGYYYLMWKTYSYGINCPEPDDEDDGMDFEHDDDIYD